MDSTSNVPCFPFIDSIRSWRFATRLVFPSTFPNASIGAINTTILLPNPLNVAFRSIQPVTIKITQQVMVVTPKGTLCQTNITIMKMVTASTIYISMRYFPLFLFVQSSQFQIYITLFQSSASFELMTNNL